MYGELGKRVREFKNILMGNPKYYFDDYMFYRVIDAHVMDVHETTT